MNSRSRTIAGALIFGAAVGSAGAGVTAENDSTTFHCRLVNVNIPPDSLHRRADNINHPPNLYVIIKRNGVKIGQHSTIHHGWSVDFPADQAANEWDIGKDDARYSIELWDSNWGSDDLALSITGLKEKDFHGEVLEQGSKGTAKDRLVRVTFELVPHPGESIADSTGKK